MAIFSKIIDRDDEKRLTITQEFRKEPLPSQANGGTIRVQDERGSLWTFKYEVKSKNKRVFSYDWSKFFRDYGVRAGDRVDIDYNDWSSNHAEFKIEVIRARY